MYTEIEKQVEATFEEIIRVGKLQKGDILAVGCSTSEVAGAKIGSASVPELGEAMFSAAQKVCKKHGVYIAAQCCEHLNRAVIIEREAVMGTRWAEEIVNAVPMPKAGGSWATAAYKFAKNPVAVEHIKADAGLDIGFTLIGMHLKEVAVPVRLENAKIGEANVLAARVRPRFIGGERAHYDEKLK